MELVKYPRGRAHARAIDATPVPGRDHHPSHEQPASPRPGPVAWIGWRVTDELGYTIGRVEHLVGEDWLVLGDRRSHHLLAPTAEAIGGGDAVFLPYPHDLIESAPRLADGATDAPEYVLQRAREHYASRRPAAEKDEI